VLAEMSDALLDVGRDRGDQIAGCNLIKINPSAELQAHGDKAQLSVEHYAQVGAPRPMKMGAFAVAL
jgi:hypothetical protein